MKPRIPLFFLITILLLVSVLMFAQHAIATSVTWSAKAPMPTARTWISAAVYGGEIYVFGGLSNTTKLATVERYNPGTNTWDSRAAMPTARYATSAVTLNGKIYVLGGVNASNQIQNIVEVYDPVNNTWSTAASMPTGLIQPVGGRNQIWRDIVSIRRSLAKTRWKIPFCQKQT